MNISPELAALIGTIIGALIGSTSTLLVTWITKRSEERKHFRELIMTSALEHWKQQIDIGLKSPFPTRVNPLYTFIIHMLKFSELAWGKDLSPENIGKILAEVDAVTEAAVKHAERVTARNNQADNKN